MASRTRDDEVSALRNRVAITAINAAIASKFPVIAKKSGSRALKIMITAAISAPITPPNARWRDLP